MPKPAPASKPADSEPAAFAPSELMRAEEVAELFNDVPVSTIHAWARRCYLPSVKIGKHRRFPRDEIQRFIETLGS